MAPCTGYIILHNKIIMREQFVLSWDIYSTRIPASKMSREHTWGHMGHYELQSFCAAPNMLLYIFQLFLSDQS